MYGIQKSWIICVIIQMTSANSNPSGNPRPAASDFKIVWNVPTQECKPLYDVDVDVTKYGILENPSDGWKGPVITIFTKREMGLLPYVADNGTIVQGGIPQAVNMTEHLAQCRQDIAHWIPDAQFSGLGIIDWEPWRLTWERNWDSKTIYQNLSIELVEEQHPNWTRREIEDKAKSEFESAARKMFVKTLHLAKSMRPKGYWGFYEYPDCYNGEGERTCAQVEKDYNDKLSWLFNESTTLYPSGYLVNSTNTTKNANHVYGTIMEAIRVKNNLGEAAKNKPIYLYSRFRYTQNVSEWFTLDDLKNTIGQAFSIGINGVILWDDHNLKSSREICMETKKYIDNVLGPYVRPLLQPEVINPQPQVITTPPERKLENELDRLLAEEYLFETKKTDKPEVNKKTNTQNSRSELGMEDATLKQLLHDMRLQQQQSDSYIATQETLDRIARLIDSWKSSRYSNRDVLNDMDD